MSAEKASVCHNSMLLQVVEVAPAIGLGLRVKMALHREGPRLCERIQSQHMAIVLLVTDPLTLLQLAEVAPACGPDQGLRKALLRKTVKLCERVGTELRIIE